MIDFILTMALSSVFALEFTDMNGTDAKKSTAKKVETGEYYQPDPNAVKAVDDFDTLTSDEFVEKYYESLRSRYPDYIRRKNIGKDDSTYLTFIRTAEAQYYQLPAQVFLHQE